MYKRTYALWFNFLLFITWLSFLASHCSAQSPKIFVIEQMRSNHASLKQLLIDRGWQDAATDEDPRFRALQNVKSPFGFKWTWSWERARVTADDQIVNHFPSFNEITTVSQRSID